MWCAGHLFRSLRTEVIDTVRLILDHTSYNTTKHTATSSYAN